MSQPHRQRADYQVIAHYLARHGTLTQTQLHRFVQFMCASAAEVRARVAELALAGFVELLYPGYQRRALTYRWTYNQSLDTTPKPGG